MQWPAHGRKFTRFQCFDHHIEIRVPDRGIAVFPSFFSEGFDLSPSRQRPPGSRSFSRFLGEQLGQQIPETGSLRQIVQSSVESSGTKLRCQLVIQPNVEITIGLLDELLAKARIDPFLEVSKHELTKNQTGREHVKGRWCVVQVDEDFGGRIHRRYGNAVPVFQTDALLVPSVPAFFQIRSAPEIHQQQIPIVNQQVGWLDVSVDDFVLVDVIQNSQQRRQNRIEGFLVRCGAQGLGNVTQFVFGKHGFLEIQSHQVLQRRCWQGSVFLDLPHESKDHPVFVVSDFGDCISIHFEFYLVFRSTKKGWQLWMWRDFLKAVFFDFPVVHASVGPLLHVFRLVSLRFVYRIPGFLLVICLFLCQFFVSPGPFADINYGLAVRSFGREQMNGSVRAAANIGVYKQGTAHFRCFDRIDSPHR
mmetsp:Transcript_7545/g.22037  ORF Transcript_7545/g.22037 Transcript_7545/m.22037 type:complete len:418 (-) Transcript_7545:374-1627(-)